METRGIYIFDENCKKYFKKKIKNILWEYSVIVVTTGKFVLFSGTPCQVAGLKSYLGKDYDNLLTVDLVCHGVPSPKAWDSYIQYRQQQDSQQQKAQTINLRSKQTGWSHYQYSVQFQYEDGSQYAKKSGEDIYMKSFVQNLTIRPSCNDCHFKGVHRCSDFTLGDFWGIWNIKPHMDDNKGTSLVLVHTEKGKKLWGEISTKYIAEQVEESDTYKENPSLIKPSATAPYRDELLNQLDTQSFAVIEEKLKELQSKEKRPSLLYRILRKIKMIIIG